MSQPAAISATDLVNYRAGDTAVIVKQVEEAIRAYCGWHIAPAVTETIRLDGYGSKHLWLPSRRVTAVSAVTNAGREVDVVNGLDWSQSGFIELRGGRWSTRPRAIEVTLTHGYAQMPADVVAVAVAIADRAKSRGGLTSEGVGQVRVTFGTVNGSAGGVASLPHELAMLAPYKVPPRA